MILQEIQNIIKKGEGISTEFKVSKNKLPKNLFETVCAFLNTKGGIILLGVNDESEVTGVNPDNIEQLKKDIANLSNNTEKLSPVYFLQVQSLEINNKHIIIIEVPESSQVHNTNKKIFVRNQDGDYLITHPVEIAKIVNRKQNYHSEQKIFPQIKLEDFETELIARAKNLIKINIPENHWWELNDKDFLIKAGFFRKNENGKSGYTLAAILFFGTDELIQTYLPAYKFEALLRRENIDRYDDRLTVRTNLIDAYDLLMSFIDKHLNDPFYVEGNPRISLRSKIFRELVANIIAHREYLSSASAVITIFKNKIEFKNPNNPKFFGKIDPDNFSPIAKNPTISKLMLLMGRVEEVGSGMYNVKKYLPFYDKNASYEFVDNDIFTTVIYFNEKTTQKTRVKIIDLIKENNDILSIELAEKVGSRLVEKVGSKLAENQLKILLLIEENPKISKKKMAEMLKISTTAIDKNIIKLKANNLLKRIGPDKGGFWELIKKSLEK
ncbi:MAG: hypothetical protein B6D61_01630 [Bacteroidetes bacterium 4484_249]|nr:MAG: hypothetical protein B6D61_01630 [Bacteroidetes bacterium 4484_249]